MKNALRNYLKEHYGVVAVYCKIVSIDDQPINDKYLVVFHNLCCDSFSIPEFFTEEELTKAKRYWKFVENWEEVKSIKNILFRLLGVDDAVEIIWKEYRKQELIDCKGPGDDNFDVTENKVENITDNMAEYQAKYQAEYQAEYQKVRMWIKRNPGKTNFPKKWSEENIALAKRLLSK